MIKRTCLINAQIVGSTKLIKKGYVTILGDKILGMGNMRSFRYRKGDYVIDVHGRLVLAGFIDQHVHGGGNADTMDATRKAFKKIAQAHTNYGTTSLCLTTVASSKEQLITICKNLRNYLQESAFKKHARIVGVNLEGPFMNPEMRGAHQEKFMAELTHAEYTDYKSIAGNYLRIITVAPETLGSLDEISKITKDSTVISLGHTKADIEIASKAFEMGAACVTHFFNAMTLFHHRAPGILGAVLNNPSVMVEIIPDPNMVHPASMKLIYKLLGPERIIIVTDALRAAASQKTKKFTFSGRKILVTKGSCYLEDGTIWGSRLTMNEAVKNFVKFTGCSLIDASMMASQNSAKLLGLENKGSLGIDKDADLVVLDEKYNVILTIVEGKIAFVKKNNLQI